MPFRIASRYDIPADIEYLKENGVILEKVSYDPTDENAAITTLKEYDGFIVIGEPFTRKICEALKGKMRYVCRNGIGFDSIDIKACTDNGICVSNTSGSMDQAVAESALLLILEASRRYFFSDRQMRLGIWNRDVSGHELEGKTVGFIGFGLIAQKLAKYLSGFECKLKVYDLYVHQEKLDAYGAQRVDTLEALAQQSDIVSVHCPLNAETRGMLSDSFFAHMKTTAYFINTARGAIVDEKALITALQKGSIAGAGLDVFENEPLAIDSPLRRMDNVCIAAHIASYTEESMMRTRMVAAQNIVDFVSGKIPRNCINHNYVDYL